MIPSLAIFAALTGCTPQICGTLWVGGGSTHLSITPSGGSPWSVSVPGTSEPGPPESGDPPGAVLGIDPNPSAGSTLELLASIPADESPCGQRLRLTAHLSWWKSAGRDTGGFGPRLQINLDELPMNAHPHDTDSLRTAFRLDQPLPVDALPDGILATGSLSVEGIPYISCAGLEPSPVQAALEWELDPEVVRDEREICW